jgi:hypothetical protein
MGFPVQISHGLPFFDFSWAAFGCAGMRLVNATDSAAQVQRHGGLAVA